MIGAVQVDENDEIMIISDKGTLVRTPVDGVSTVGRNTQGVTLIRTVEGEKVVALQRIEEIQAPEHDGEAIEGEVVDGEVSDNVAPQADGDETPPADAE